MTAPADVAGSVERLRGFGAHGLSQSDGTSFDGAWPSWEQHYKDCVAVADALTALTTALETISDYDKHSGTEGLCPYGCDTPWIAREALSAGRARP